MEKLVYCETCKKETLQDFFLHSSSRRDLWGYKCKICKCNNETEQEENDDDNYERW